MHHDCQSETAVMLDNVVFTEEMADVVVCTCACKIASFDF